MRWNRIALTTIMLSAIFGAIANATEPIVKIDRVRSDRVMSAGFTIQKEGDFKIKAVGLLGRHSDDFMAYAWLLDGTTRKPVWVMERPNTTHKDREELRQADQSIHLKPGKYELYYYAGTNWVGDINFQGGDVFRFLGDLFNGNWRTDIEDYLNDLNAAIYPANDNYKDYSLYTPDGKFDDAIVQFNQVGDSKYLQQGFTLDKPMSLHVYGMCEFPSGYKSPSDYAWIINSDTHAKVWTMDRWDTDPAGGGRKNRLTDTDIKLDKGNYILIYVTDDSHSFDDFNAMPPYDPLNWGIALLPTKDTDHSAVHLFQPKGRGEALIDMTRVGDNQSLSKAFKLDQDMSLRILSLGEYNDEFTDYGWIEDASTSKTVWEMTYRNTEFAGGSSKNRIFDEAITLPKGSYVVHYISDDSHSYGDWNDSPPYLPESWGISIFPGADFDKSKFHVIDDTEARKSSDVLVKMTRLGDNARERSKFTLNNKTKIHIYAIGEGSSDGMMDFGWIVDDKSGKSIWEMTWRNTEPAGGALKNRMFDDSIVLEPGTYEVNFVTDGSHSFNNWNSAKPRDPASWGITISINDD